MNLFDTSNPWVVWALIPALIFLARVFDVSIGTIRVIFVSRGMKFLAPLLGFFEVLVWIIAVSQIMAHLTNPLYYIAYAAGFATGNFIGIEIENKLALGVVSVRAITHHSAQELVGVLRQRDYGVTSLIAEGATGPVNLIYTLVQRQRLPEVIDLIRTYNPNAFYIVEDVRFVREGVFPSAKPRPRMRLMSWKKMLPVRK